MDELESQIAKIQLGSPKATSSYVHITAEKATGSNAELYVVAELPLLNPAAADSCEKICLAIASSLKRSYRLPVTANSFENALGQINEEMGKLASLGQTHWVDKLNCIIGVKDGKNFTIASCGKVTAFLYRNQEFTDISCSSSGQNPLKTFENYANGKIKLGDLLILSTTQLFNHLSMDRLKNILANTEFLGATQTVIEILKENAGPEVAFGTILNLQVPLGQTTEEEIDLETYILEKPAGHPSPWIKAWNYAKAIIAAKEVKRMPKVNLPKISFAQRLKNFGGNTKTFMFKGKGLMGALGRGVVAGKRAFDFRRFKEFSPQKKFFLITALALLLVVVINVIIALYVKKTRVVQRQISDKLKQAQTLLANAQSSLLYNDNASTVSFVMEARSMLPGQDAKLNPDNKDLYSKVSAELSDLQQKLDKNLEVKVASLGGLGQADNLIRLQDYVAIQAGGQLVSYNKNTGKIEDGILKSPETILAAAKIGQNKAVTYNGSSLFVWDYAGGKLGAGLSQSVPAKDGFVGLAFYATNSRVYSINKPAGQIISYAVIGDNLSKPVVAIRDNALNQAKDLAIDGSIYVLTGSGVMRYQAGSLTDFKLPFLVTPFSGEGKIYTEKDWKYLFLLDAGNNRILLITKSTGQLFGTIKAKEFTKLKDFAVDEKSKIIYLLNDSSLLRVTY